MQHYMIIRANHIRSFICQTWLPSGPHRNSLSRMAEVLADDDTEHWTSQVVEKLGMQSHSTRLIASPAARTLCDLVVYMKENLLRFWHTAVG